MLLGNTGQHTPILKAASLTETYYQRQINLFSLAALSIYTCKSIWNPLCPKYSQEFKLITHTDPHGKACNFRQNRSLHPADDTNTRLSLDSTHGAHTGFQRNFGLYFCYSKYCFEKPEAILL